MPYLSQSEKVKLAEQIKPISQEQAKNSYLDLADEKTIPPSTSTKGNTFIDYFTFLERLETTGNKGISFWEFWENKSEYMKKNYVKNILNYLSKKGNSNAVKNLYSVFKLYFGSVGIFKPVIAMNIYQRFKPTSVLDFTMGWGGRLVGATALDIPKYIGIDLNKNLEKPYREMETTLKELGTNTNIKLIFEDALKVDYSKLDYDMVFTSPPYYNKEIYRGTNKMTEEEWDEKFYRPIFTKTWKYLKNGGHYILNVPISVYDNVLVKLLGKADIIIPMNTKRGMSKKLKQTEYKEFIYVWIKNGMKQGGSIELDNFEESGIVSLPKFQSVKINLPTYMYKRLPDIKGKPPPYRYRLVVPITSSRNLSSRKKENSIVINQKPVAKPIVDIADNGDPPLLEEFSPADRRKIQNYYYNLKANETKDIDDIDKDEYAIVPRGRPLPCGNKKAVTPKPKGKKINLKTASSQDDNQDFNLGDLYNSGKSSSSKTPTKASSISSHSNPMYKASSVSSASSLPSKLSSLASLSSKKSSKASSVASSASFPTDKSSVKAPSVKAPPPAPAPAPAPKKKLVIPVKAPSVSSEGSSDLDSEDERLFMEDYDAFKKKHNIGQKKGKGIENIISTKNKMPNKWIEYVKQFAKTNGITYRDALRDPKCKAGYSSKSGGGGGYAGRANTPEERNASNGTSSNSSNSNRINNSSNSSNSNESHYATPADREINELEMELSRIELAIRTAENRIQAAENTDRYDMINNNLRLVIAGLLRRQNEILQLIETLN